MIDLILSIVFATSLFAVFSVAKRYGITPLPVIVINYFTAAISGYVVVGSFPDFSVIVHSQWFPMAMLMGSCFITSFNLMGKTTQQMGVNVAAVASKMSMVIPVLSAILYFGEDTSPLKVIAILMAFAAVYLTSVKDSSNEQKGGSLLLPILLFLGCGLVDLLINASEKLYGSSANFNLMPATLFLIAGSIGLLYILIFQRNILKSINLATVLSGIVLGVFNYLSLHYIYRALKFSNLPSSTLFPLINVGVVGLSALIAALIFKETISRKNLIGLFISLIALILLMY